MTDLRVQRHVRQGLRHRLRHAEVDDLHRQLVVRTRRHQNVRGLQITVDHTLHVRVLHRFAHLYHQFEPLPCV